MRFLLKSNYLKAMGFSIIELIVVVGISGIVLLAMSTSITVMYSMQAHQNLTFSRNEIAARIRITAMTPGTLENSAILTNSLGADGLLPSVGTATTFTRFDRLMKCHPAFTEPSQTGCDRSEVDVSGRGNFFYLSAQNSTDPQTALAGEYIHYTANGSRCTQTQAQSSSQCPIFARVWAEPYCLNFASTCNKAMSISIRYSVGIRDDYIGGAGTKPTTLEGDVTVPLQKGIQITRVLDQGNNPLVPNGRGIYGIEKYYGYPDQVGSPQMLRFEVLVGNPTGLRNIRIQMRAITGASVRNVGDSTIPPEINSLTWVDVPNPDNIAESWIISLSDASQNQTYNFGAANAVKGFRIGARYDLANEDLLKRNYLFHFDAAGTALVPPLLFRSGVYQFRVIALDTGDNRVESTNYATVRIFPRPQMYLAAATPIPSGLQRNCVGDERNLNLNVMLADDEDLLTSSYTITSADGAVVASGNSSHSGYTSSFPLVFDKSRPAGTYLIRHEATNRSTGLVLRGLPIPPTVVSTLPASLQLNEVTPVTGIVSQPSQIRVGGSGVVSFSYSTGNCCTVTPTVSWTFPNVPEAGNLPMLSSPGPNTELDCVNQPNGTRTCTSTDEFEGVREGPATASPNISAALNFSGTVPPACQLTSTATLRYIRVVSLPGIQFFNPESLWVTLPTAGGGAVRAQDRRVRIKMDFPPENEAVTVNVTRPDSTPICSGITFPAGTGDQPVIRDCAIPAGYNGDMVLTRASTNIKSSADAVSDGWQAALVDGQLNHRVCDMNLGSSSGPFPTDYNIPFTLPMSNAPWGLNPDGTQKASNDTGTWNAGTEKTLRCWDSWSTFSSSSNQQDGFYAMDLHNTGRAFGHQRGISLNFSFPTFYFPYNGSSSPDFTARNVPYIFVVSRGAPASVTYRFSSGSAQTSDSTGHAWTNVTASYCNGSTSLSNVQLYMNQLRGFDSATHTMKAVNSARVGQNPVTNMSYAFLCTYGRYSPNGEGP